MSSWRSAGDRAVTSSASVFAVRAMALSQIPQAIFLELSVHDVVAHARPKLQREVRQHNAECYTNCNVNHDLTLAAQRLVPSDVRGTRDQS
jgi:hypothetical protein